MKKIGDRYILEKSEYYCHLESFVLTPKPIVMTEYSRKTTAANNNQGWARRRLFTLDEDMDSMISTSMSLYFNFVRIDDDFVSYNQQSRLGTAKIVHIR